MNCDLEELRALLPNCLRQDRARLEAKVSRIVRDLRPGCGDAQLAELVREARRAVEVRHQRYEKLPQISYPQGLPISARKDEIVAAIRAHPVVIIAGETGSGKTTQIPKMCLEAGCGLEGKIGCTQPRRVAALSISRRIAEELNVRWGQEVGCKIRFTDRSSAATYIKLMTDGILLAETQGDRELTEYDAIVIDEAHERSLNIDFLLGHLKLLLRRRSDLKVIITSATIDTDAFSKAFDDAPVLEVSGRTYPVEIHYAPHDEAAEESGELTYIDAAVAATEQVLLESDRGDILIFMPSERDIRETQDDLHGRYGSEAEIIPLYGRLASGEQDRVFAPSMRRKIIVATNIAETSLTIPGVRYVIDTGLARISRYSPRTRTKRLPIEPISQSSARQRAGRSGRMENGVCIRLYAEADWAGRPKDTQPEIQRANLAEVILKMKAWRLGEMETFPFINPPQPQAIQSGYQLLQELGALNEERQLTPLGRDLARLPVDPSIGRMILQSIQERALSDVLIIAAGLSIQDPRERPQDKQEAADAAHRQFIDSRSDFLTLLNVWNAYDAQFESLKTQNQMRRFCHANFLSYPRMREWMDVHAQLEEAVNSLRSLGQGTNPESGLGQRSAADATARGATEPGTGPDARRPGVAQSRRSEHARPASRSPFDARYMAIHRSILAGLLGHIAQRTERNLYRASGNRQLMLWPGSGLFDRNAKQEKGREADRRHIPPGPADVRQPAWLVGGEVVETSRLFIRTVAALDAAWIAELGAHLCKRSYGEPFWERRSGRVLSRERVTLFGLEVQETSVDFGRVDPQGATDLFIRAALIGEELEVTPKFVEHNRKLRQKVAVWRTHHRNHRLPNPDDALFTFYSERLQGISSVHDLNRLIRERAGGSPNFLCATENDLTGGVEVAWDSQAFPTEVSVADQPAKLEYAYAPGEEHDGITVKLPAALAHRVEARMLDWLVPGLRAEQIEFLLKSLPKSLRVPLMPIGPKVTELAALLPSDAGLEGLRELIRARYSVVIPAGTWTRDSLPDHLRPRIEITGANEKVLAAGRDLMALKQGIEQHESPAEQQAWQAAVQRWERYDLRAWPMDDIPERISVTEVAGAPLIAFPGLACDDGAVHLKLYRKQGEAEAASQQGVVRLAELALQKELAWLQKDLRTLEKLHQPGLSAKEEFLRSAYENVRNYLIVSPQPALPLSRARFDPVVSQARARLPGVVQRFLGWVTLILTQRAELMKQSARNTPEAKTQKGIMSDLKQLGPPRSPAGPKAPGFLSEELNQLLPADFLARIPFERLQHLPRYLKALSVRTERALLNPGKDADKAGQVRPYTAALLELGSRQDLSLVGRQALQEFRWLLEEFKVSVFAQELGTAQPVSPKRLDAALAQIRSAG